MSPYRLRQVSERGQGMPEYVLILVLVALFLLATWILLGDSIVNFIQEVIGYI